MPPFRINSKSYIVTYPQCDLDKQVVLQWFQREHELLGIRVAAERHEDGQPHIHVVFHLGRAYSSRNARCFDIQGYHPNIQATRSLPAAYDYLRKDGDFCDYGTIPVIEADISWADIINAPTKEEALRLAKEKSPRDYVLQYDRLLSFCEQHFTTSTKEYESTFDFTQTIPPPQLTQWNDQRLEVSFASAQHALAARYPPNPPLRGGSTYTVGVGLGVGVGQGLGT